MYIVTIATDYGNYTPAVFRTKDEAAFYKRAVAITNAAESNYVDYFGEEFGEDRLGALLLLCDKLRNAIQAGGTFVYTPEENDLANSFVSFLEKEYGCRFSETSDCIVYTDDSVNHIEVFDVPGFSAIQTSAGTASSMSYDDGCAKGIHIFLDEEIVCSLDVYEPEEGETEGEARVLAYKKEYADDEEESPIACISINR